MKYLDVDRAAAIDDNVSTTSVVDFERLNLSIIHVIERPEIPVGAK